MPDDDVMAAIDRLRAPVSRADVGEVLGRRLDAATVSERAAAIEREAERLPPGAARAAFRALHRTDLARAAAHREQAAATIAEARDVAASEALAPEYRKVLDELAAMPAGPVRAHYRRQHRQAIEAAEAEFQRIANEGEPK